MERPKTIFCDIDGTLWKHVGSVSEQTLCPKYEVLSNTLKAIDKWDRSGYKIILTTGRKESLRDKTEKELLRLGIVYDKLIMGLGGGVRILINDRKPKGNKNTCYAINLVRNKGIDYFDFTSEFVVIPSNKVKFIEQKWGSEEYIEYNSNYIVKKIILKNRCLIPLRYHELKRKTIYILSGKIQLKIGTDINNLEVRELMVDDKITITTNTIYSISGIIDSEYLECSTPEINDVCLI